MDTIRYIDRETKQEKVEKVYGGFFLRLLYGSSFFSKLLSSLFLSLFTKTPLLSQWYGYLQNTKFSKRKILPFIQQFSVSTEEFLDPTDSFTSFNDFFIRKLKPSCRPIAFGHDIPILPADGRYLVYENIARSDGFLVKGKKFCLETLLQDATLATKYENGSLVIARLAPVDYHRFHFPISCQPGTPKEIPGSLFSVNPIALKKNISFLTENKRAITPLYTKNFGTILYIEVGATYVGTIHQTFIPNEPYAKGEEKGYFSFGGSCILLLFEPSLLQIDQDLLDASALKIETLGKMGQSLGRAFSPL